MATAWSNIIADWQGVDDEPTAGSNNLVNSGGVAEKLTELEMKIDGGKTKKSLNATLGQNITFDDSKANVDIKTGETFIVNVETQCFLGCTIYASSDGGATWNVLVNNANTNYDWSLSAENDINCIAIWVDGTSVSANGEVDINIAIDGKKGITEEIKDIKSQLVLQEEQIEDLGRDGSVTINKISDNLKVIKYGKNLIDESLLVGGYFNTSNGQIEANPSYKTTGLISVESGETYTYSDSLGWKGRFCGFFGESDGEIIYLGGATSLENIDTFTTPNNAKYVRITCYYADEWIQLEKGTSATDYEHYVHPSVGFIVAEDYIDKSNLKTNLVQRIYGISNPYLHYEGNLNSGQTVILGNNKVKTHKRFSLTAKISSFDKLIIGHGVESDYLSSWIEINNTQVVRYWSTSGASSWGANHGLTITNNIQVVLEQGVESKVRLRLTSNGETVDTWEFDDWTWYGSAGDIYIKSVGTELTNVSASWICNADKADLWLFGDSYLAFDDPKRWIYYLMKDGHTNHLINAQSGGGSASTIQDVFSLLKLGIPKTIVWCLGMNDRDNPTSVNTSWLDALNKLKTLSNKYGITLVLATIPNVPTINNTFKNEVVRNSGYRYIDFAKAVNAEDEGSSWYEGMLDDGVHPNEKGAITLYHQAISDCPEL